MTLVVKKPLGGVPLGAGSNAGDRTELARRVILFLTAALAAVIVFGLAHGASDVAALPVILSWFGLESGPPPELRDRIVVESIRLPRIVMGCLVGASLAVAGAIMQGLFRNPLADPGLVGISAGATLGAVSTIVLGGTSLAWFTAGAGIFALPLAAFLGALLSAFALYRISTSAGVTSIAIMLLGGIALAAMANAVSGLLIFVSDDQQLRDLTFWSLGSLAGATWQKIAVAGPIMALALSASFFLARGLNAIVLGEAAASHLGISVQCLKNLSIVVLAAASGAAVAVSGGIGFVGIVVPHLLRLAIGPDHNYLLPASALLGAALLLLADVVSRTVVAPAELPIGIVTAIFGTPFFLWILLTRRSALGL